MLCQNCGKNEVNFRYTQIVNGVKKEMALCDKCAKELGLETIYTALNTMCKEEAKHGKEFISLQKEFFIEE